MNLELLRIAQIEINIVNCFSFRLPVEAVGIKEKSVVEIVVEYGQSAQDDAVMFAKIWARKPYNIISGYIFGLFLPYIEKETPLDCAGRICDALNVNKQFMSALRSFWTSVLRDLPDV